jgi:hypothetical protein
VVVVLLPPTEKAAERSWAEQFGRFHSPRNSWSIISPACSNHSDMFSDLRFIPGYAFAASQRCAVDVSKIDLDCMRTNGLEEGRGL